MSPLVGIAQTVERDLYTVKAAGSMPALNTQGTVGSLENTVFNCASGARTLHPHEGSYRDFPHGTHKIVRLLTAITPKSTYSLFVFGQAARKNNPWSYSEIVSRLAFPLEITGAEPVAITREIGFTQCRL